MRGGASGWAFSAFPDDPPPTDRLLAIATTGGSGNGVYYPLYDGNGNVLATLRDTGSSTTEASAYHYDPFGNTIVTAGYYSDENPFRFSTKYFDMETGFYYYGYRYYDRPNGA